MEYGKQKKYSDMLKLPTIHQNKSISIVEAKDNNSSSSKFKSSLPMAKSKMPVINKKSSNVINSSHRLNNNVYETPMNKLLSNGKYLKEKNKYIIHIINFLKTTYIYNFIIYIRVSI